MTTKKMIFTYGRAEIDLTIYDDGYSRDTQRLLDGMVAGAKQVGATVILETRETHEERL